MGMNSAPKLRPTIATLYFLPESDISAPPQSDRVQKRLCQGVNRSLGDDCASKDTSALIIVCRASGRRSSKAAAALKTLGYVRVVDFGSIKRWVGPLRLHAMDPR